MKGLVVIAWTVRHSVRITIRFTRRALSTLAAQILGGEQFLAFFLTAGMVSSLASYGGRLARNGANYSLGASGAAWACVAAFTMHYPGRHAHQ